MGAQPEPEPEPWAYAKLWGKHNGNEIAKHVTELPAKIGRASTGQTPKEKGFIDLGTDAKVRCKLMTLP